MTCSNTTPLTNPPTTTPHQTNIKPQAPPSSTTPHTPPPPCFPCESSLPEIEAWKTKASALLSVLSEVILLPVCVFVCVCVCVCVCVRVYVRACMCVQRQRHFSVITSVVVRGTRIKLLCSRLITCISMQGLGSTAYLHGCIANIHMRQHIHECVTGGQNC